MKHRHSSPLSCPVSDTDTDTDACVRIEFGVFDRCVGVGVTVFIAHRARITQKRIDIKFKYSQYYCVTVK